MKLLKWLYPGMLVKRWIFITTIGVVFISMGFAIMISEQMARNKTFASGVILVGILFVITGMKRMVKSFVTVFLPEEGSRLVDRVYAKRILERGPRVVALGGGHGLSTLLHGLKEYTTNITAIVTVADDGGSSGRLREEFDILPPGDIRNCLVALADAEDLMQRLFQFRFSEGKDLKGHSFGNLFITAMTRVTGDFEQAVKESSKVLSVRGNVVPSTTDKVVLVAEHKDGSQTEGESKIPQSLSPIRKMYIRPEACVPTKEAVDAIRKADVIVIGPGSLYTSLVPNLLIKGIAAEIFRSKAQKVFVCNAMTQHGETDGYRVSDHLRALIDHAGKGIVKHVIVNGGSVPEEILSKYAREYAYPVVLDSENVKKLGCDIIKSDIVSTEGYVRHNPTRLVRLILNLVANED
ncbi:MAG: YvcK family protein [Candidatus Omnitrophica bacterium]|nr:YvcK family protein [Candidatus Omnitrophota bacterium]